MNRKTYKIGFDYDNYDFVYQPCMLSVYCPAQQRRVITQVITCVTGIVDYTDGLNQTLDSTVVVCTEMS